MPSTCQTGREFCFSLETQPGDLCYVALMIARKSAAVTLLVVLMATSFVVFNQSVGAQIAPGADSSVADTRVPLTKTLPYHLSTNAVGHARGFEGNFDDMFE